MQNIQEILGPKCCESFHFLGREKGHQLRSNHVRFEGGTEGIYCVFCGVALPTTIDILVNGSGKRALPVDHTTVHEYRFQFNYGPDYLPSQSLASVVFDRPEQFQLDADESLGRDFDPSEFGSLPQTLANIGKQLSAIGFRVVAPTDLDEFHRHGYRSITMVRGQRLVPGKPALDGVRVALTYIV